MSYFDIKISQFGDQIVQLQGYVQKLQEYIEQVKGVKRTLEKMGKSNLLQIEDLDNVIQEMDIEATNLKSFQKALVDITQLYLQAEGKLTGTEDNLCTLAYLQAKGVTIEGGNENPLADSKTRTGNWGNLFGGLGESAIGISAFIDAGFEIVERGGKYFIKGGKEIRNILNLPKNIKLSSVMRAGSDSDIYKNIQKAFKLDKFLNLTKNAKLDKITKGIAKSGAILAWGSAILDVGEDIYENTQNNATTTKIVGDAIGDSALAAGGVAVGSFGATNGATAGAAIGTMVCPGAGTLVGGVVGGIGGAFASGWVYSKLTSLEIQGKSVEEWVDTGCTNVVEVVTDVGSDIGKGVSNVCGQISDSISDTLKSSWNNVCGL